MVIEKILSSMDLGNTGKQIDFLYKGNLWHLEARILGYEAKELEISILGVNENDLSLGFYDFKTKQYKLYLKPPTGQIRAGLPQLKFLTPKSTKKVVIYDAELKDFIKPLDKKVGESEDNLNKRGEWFKDKFGDK